MDYQSGAVSPVGSIQRGWEIIKGNYWMFFAMTLVAGVIVLIVSLILGLINDLIAGVIAGALGLATQNASDVAKVSAALAPRGISLFIGLFTNIFVITLSGALYCGIYAALSRTASTGAVEFGDLFSGFQKIQQCAIVAVVMSVIGFVVGLFSLVVMATVGVAGFASIAQGGQINPAALGGIFVGMLIFVIFMIVANLIVSSLTSFIYPLVGDRDLSAGEAIMTSIKSGLGNLVGMILMLILLGLMLFGGFLVCGLGLLFVAPIVPAAIFAAYQSVFGQRDAGRYRYEPPAPPDFGRQPGY